MPNVATPADFFILPASADTWTDLGASTVRFNTMTVSGYKASGTANTGNVRLRPTSGEGYIIIEPETDYVITAPQGSFYRANQFQVYAEESGDGLYCIYSSAIVYEGP